MLNLKKKLNTGELTIGSWITINSVENVEIMTQFNFDWLTVDMEHSAITLQETQKMVRIIQSANIPALVRVEENNTNIIKRVMDTGANGVIVPMIKSKEDAQQAVAAVKYPPQGVRGVGLTRAQGYGMKFDAYKEWLDKESVVIAIIEHIDAITNLDKILSVEGVDATMIGPYDLSGSLGYPGEYEREDVAKCLKIYQKACDDIGKPSGYHVVPPENELLNCKIKDGFKFLAFSNDALFLGHKIDEELRHIKK